MYGTNSIGCEYRKGSIRFGCNSCDRPFLFPRVSVRKTNCHACRQKTRKCESCGAEFASIRAKRCLPCAQKHYRYMDTERGAREAHSKVAGHIRKGLLPHPSTLTCVDCGRPAQQYDHRDYGKPLDVHAVCRSCNLRRGSAIPAGATKAIAA